MGQKACHLHSSVSPEGASGGTPNPQIPEKPTAFKANALIAKLLKAEVVDDNLICLVESDLRGYLDLFFPPQCLRFF